MKAYESKAKISPDRKLEILDLPWDEISDRASIKVIVMVEDDDEDEILDSPVESFRQAWQEVKEGKVTPIEQLWNRAESE
jgi:hypothetical protein